MFCNFTFKEIGIARQKNVYNDSLVVVCLISTCLNKTFPIFKVNFNQNFYIYKEEKKEVFFASPLNGMLQFVWQICFEN